MLNWPYFIYRVALQLSKPRPRRNTSYRQLAEHTPQDRLPVAQALDARVVVCMVGVYVWGWWLGVRSLQFL